MSKVLTPVALIAVGLGVGGWLLAQQPATPGGQPGGPGAGIGKGPMGPQGQPGNPPPPATARFAVSGGGEGAMMVETQTGKSWVLHRGPGGVFAWLPIRRIDSEQDAAKIMEHEKTRERELDEDRELLRKRQQDAQQRQQQIQQQQRRQQQLQQRQRELQQEQEAIKRELEQLGSDG